MIEGQRECKIIVAVHHLLLFDSERCRLVLQSGRVLRGLAVARRRAEDLLVARLQEARLLGQGRRLRVALAV